MLLWKTLLCLLVLNLSLFILASSNRSPFAASSMDEEFPEPKALAHAEVAEHHVKILFCTS